MKTVTSSSISQWSSILWNLWLVLENLWSFLQLHMSRVALWPFRFDRWREALSLLSTLQPLRGFLQIASVTLCNQFPCMCMYSNLPKLDVKCSRSSYCNWEKLKSWKRNITYKYTHVIAAVLAVLGRLKWLNASTFRKCCCTFHKSMNSVKCFVPFRCEKQCFLCGLFLPWETRQSERHHDCLQFFWRYALWATLFNVVYLPTSPGPGISHSQWPEAKLLEQCSQLNVPLNALLEKKDRCNWTWIPCNSLKCRFLDLFL